MDFDKFLDGESLEQEDMYVCFSFALLVPLFRFLLLSRRSLTARQCALVQPGHASYPAHGGSAEHTYDVGA